MHVVQCRDVVLGRAQVTPDLLLRYLPNVNLLVSRLLGAMKITESLRIIKLYLQEKAAKQSLKKVPQFLFSAQKLKDW